MHVVHLCCRGLLLQQQQQQQAVGLPERVVISAGRSRQRDHISGLLRDSTLALLTSWNSPFAFVASSEGSTQGNGNGNGNGSSSNSSAAAANNTNSKLEALGVRVAEWLLQDNMQAVLSGFMRQPRRKSSSGSGPSTSIINSIAADLATETKLDKRCQEAFAAVKEFESNHCLSVQSMGNAYTAARAGLVTALLGLQDKLQLRDDVVHDAVLLMDRAMSASLKVIQHSICHLSSTAF